MKNTMTILIFALLSGAGVQARTLLDCPLGYGSSDIYGFRVVENVDGKIHKELELSGSVVQKSAAKKTEIENRRFQMKFPGSVGFTRKVDVVLGSDGYWILTSLDYAFKYIADLECQGPLSQRP